MGARRKWFPLLQAPSLPPKLKLHKGPAVPHHAPVHVPPSRALTSLLQPRPLGWQAAVGARFVAERPSTECPSWSTLHYSSAARQLTTRSSTLPLWTTRSGSRRGRCLRNRWKASWPGRSLSIARAPQGLWTSRPLRPLLTSPTRPTRRASCSPFPLLSPTLPSGGRKSCAGSNTPRQPAFLRRRRT